MNAAAETCQGCTHWQGRAIVDQKGQVMRRCRLFRRYTAKRCAVYADDGKPVRKEGN